MHFVTIVLVAALVGVIWIDGPSQWSHLEEFQQQSCRKTNTC